MKKKLKNIIIGAIMAVTLTVPLTVSAEYKLFSFSLSDQGGSSWSSANEKDDNEQLAYINTTGGNVSSSNACTFTLYKSQTATEANRLTNNKTISSNNAKYTIPYTVLRGAGSFNYIRANAGYYGCSVSGNWYS